MILKSWNRRQNESWSLSSQSFPLRRFQPSLLSLPRNQEKEYPFFTNKTLFAIFLEVLGSLINDLFDIYREAKLEKKKIAEKKERRLLVALMLPSV